MELFLDRLIGKLRQREIPKDSSAHLKHNWESNTDPTINDDINKGYSIGSRWVNATTEKIWICTNNTTGNAQWTDSTAESALAILFSPTDEIKSTDVQRAIEEINNLSLLIGKPTGFVDRSESAMNFNDFNRTFSIVPSSGIFNYYTNGIKRSKTFTDIIQISDIEGFHYIYYDGIIIKETTTFSYSLIVDYPLISIIYWDKDNQKHLSMAEKRHGMTIDGETCKQQYISDGTSWVYGFLLGNFTIDGNGNNNNHAQFSVGSGSILYEDIQLELSSKPFPANLPIFYRTGTQGLWRKDNPTNFPVKTYPIGDNRLAYNPKSGASYIQTEVPNNKYILCPLFATNSYESVNKIIAIQGQNYYNTKFEAYQNIGKELNNNISIGLPFFDYISIGTLIYKTSNSFTNNAKAIIVSTPDNNNYFDQRYVKGVSTKKINSHVNLYNMDYDESGHKGFQKETISQSTNPTINDDISKNYNNGLFWLNSTTEDLFKLVDNTLGNAKWVNIADSFNKNEWIYEEFILTGTDISNKYITLLNIPSFPNTSEFKIKNSIIQIYGNDFIIDGNKLKWDGYNLENELDSNDKLTIKYIK